MLNKGLTKQEFQYTSIKNSLIKIKNIMESVLTMPVLDSIRSLYRNLKRMYNGIRYQGNQVYCPCCCHSFRSFCSYFLDDRTDQWGTNSTKVYCPFCASAVRHRILCDYFNKNKHLFTNLEKKDILLFAPEKSILTWMKKNDIAVTTTDLYKKHVDIQMDIQDLAKPDNSFSVIICNMVLEHVADYHRSLDELYRVLRPSGIFFTTVPILESLESTYEDVSITSKEGRLERFGQADHLRIFGRDFIHILNGHGFQVTVIDGAECDPKMYTDVVGPVKWNGTKVFACEKKACE